MVAEWLGVDGSAADRSPDIKTRSGLTKSQLIWSGAIYLLSFAFITFISYSTAPSEVGDDALWKWAPLGIGALSAYLITSAFRAVLRRT